MKLALITQDGTAHCLVCTWKWKVPAHRSGSSRGLKDLILLSKEKRRELLEERILAHLRDSHDRMLIMREEVEYKDQREEQEGLFKKTYYSGRSPFQ